MNDGDRARVKRYRQTAKGKAMRAAQRKRLPRDRKNRWNLERRRRARAFVDALKSVPCADCGGTFDPICMDFDHRPGEEKCFAIARSVDTHFNLRTGPRPSLLLEIQKCDIVCSNCHRIRTYRKRNHADACLAGKRSKSVEVSPS